MPANDRRHLSRAAGAPGRASGPGPDLAVDRGRHGLAERHVPVDRADEQHAGLAVGPGVELPDQPVAVQDREGVVAPPALGGRLVHLEVVVELEDLGHPLAVVQQPVERREQRGPAGEGLPELRRVDPPLPAHALDDRRLARPRRRRAARPGTRGPRARAMPRAPRRRSSRSRRASSEPRHRVVRVDAGGEVPQPVASLAAGGRDLAALHEEVEHHRDVAVVVPAARGPGLHAGVGQLALGQRPVGAEPLEDVAPAGVVRRDPVALVLLPVPSAHRSPATPPSRRDRARGPRPAAACPAARSATARRPRPAAPAASTPNPAGSTARGRRSGRSRWSGSSCTRESRRTVSTRSVGRSFVSSCARTAMRRASVRLSWWTVAMTASVGANADSPPSPVGRARSRPSRVATPRDRHHPRPHGRRAPSRPSTVGGRR